MQILSYDTIEQSPHNLRAHQSADTMKTHPKDQNGMNDHPFASVFLEESEMGDVEWDAILFLFGREWGDERTSELFGPCLLPGYHRLLPIVETEAVSRGYQVRHPAKGDRSHALIHSGQQTQVFMSSRDMCLWAAINFFGGDR